GGVGVERQPVDEGARLAPAARLLHVTRVGGEDGGLVAAEAARRPAERGVAGGVRAARERAGGGGRGGGLGGGVRGGGERGGGGGRGVGEPVGRADRVVGKRLHADHSISPERAGASSVRSSRWMTSSLPL